MAAPDTLLQNDNKSATEILQSLANTDTYEDSQNIDFEQKLTLSEHSPDTILHKKRALCVPKNLPDDLKELIKRWADLPESIKESIKLLVKSVAT